MFPFQNGELSFQVSNDFDDIINYNNNININTTNTPITTTTPLPITTTHYVNQPHNETITPIEHLKSSTTRKRRSKKIALGLDNANYINNNEDELGGSSDIIAQKKIIHREVERQRRQEMSTLHSSLRSLLPIEYIRGKRSICDHVTEAANYIKDLEKNVKELGEQRDKLKESFSSFENQINTNGDYNFGYSASNSTTCISRTGSSSSINGYNVSIHKFSRTLQIEVSTGVGYEDPYPLSKTLKVLAEEGLDVVSCVSSIVNQRWIYVIYCEINDVASIDSIYLQDKLMSDISSGDA